MNIEELPRTLASVASLKLDKNGNIKKRSKVKHGLAINAEVIAAIESVVRRPAELSDVTVEMAHILILRWRSEGFDVAKLRQRKLWFERVNTIAAKLGWADPLDFTRIGLRATNWRATRHDMPDPPAEETATGDDIGTMPLVDMLNNHYRRDRLIGKSGETLRLYKHSINALSKWLGRRAVIRDLNVDTVSGYLQFLLTETELSPHTIKKDQTQLLAIWRYAARKRWLPEYPDMAAINAPDRVPDAWSDAELSALMKACERMPGMLGDVPANAFWPALVSVIYDTGERIGAILQTRWQDINSDGWLTVKGEHRKGGKRDKRFKLHELTIARINKTFESRKKAHRVKLFDWPFCESHIFVKFGKVLEAAGLPNTRRNKFHRIRRTTASNFEAAGGNATKLLDHCNRQITVRNYLDPSTIKELQPCDVVRPIGDITT